MPTESRDLPSSYIKNRGPNYFLTLAGILTAAVLPMLLFFLVGDQITRKETLGIYVKMVATVPVLFLAFYFLNELFQKRFLEETCSFHAAYVTLIVPTECVLVALAVINKLSLRQYMITFVLIHLVFVSLWLLAGKRITATTVFMRINKWVIDLLPVVYAGIFWVWFIWRYRPGYGLRSIALLILGAVSFALFTRFVPLQKLDLRFRSHWWVYLLLGLFLVGLVYQPELPYDRHHQNFFLAAVNDVMHGKWLFVDATSQYGVGVIYLLAAIFRVVNLPTFYSAFSLILVLLYVLQYALIFLILKKATRSLLISVAGLGIILYFNYIAVFWPGMLRVPAQTPLRYGLTYLLLSIGLSGFEGKKRQWQIIELALLGVTALWSLETLVYTILALDAFHFVKDVLFAQQLKTGIGVFCKRIFYQAGIILLCWAVWLAITYWGSGQWPNLHYYLDFFGSYTIADRYDHPLDFRSFWSGVVPGIYLLSILAVLFIRFKGKDYLSANMASLLVGVSVTGLLQYTYFFVYDIDYHLSLLCVPLILVLMLWVSIAHQTALAGRVTAFGRLSFGLALVVSFWLCIVQTHPWFYANIRKSMLYALASSLTSGRSIDFANPYRAQPTNPTVSNLVEMIQQYAPTQPQIAIFAQPDDEVEALLLTGKTHLLDITDPDMSSASPTYMAHIMSRAEQLAGRPEAIFYDPGDGALIELQQEAFRTLVSGAPYIVVDQNGNLVTYTK